MTTKKATTKARATADPLRDDNKKGNDKNENNSRSLRATTRRQE
jgi:hypothetical protein